jgi:hypothetical protein
MHVLACGGSLGCPAPMAVRISLLTSKLISSIASLGSHMH